MSSILQKLIFGLVSLLITCDAIAGNAFQKFDPNLHEKINGKYAMKNQMLVAVRSDVDSFFYIDSFNAKLKSQGLKFASSELISTNSTKLKIIKLNLQPGHSLAALQEPIQQMSNVVWTQPNYIYNINFDPRESVYHDPKLKNQYHHTLMKDRKAWSISTGYNVVVAVTDDGFDLNHEDLSSRFIKNKGYNFCDDNTNVSFNYSSGTHGTHVSGIIAAELDNRKGGAGVAGNATILPIKFYSGMCNWTSEKIYKAYQYSADNGAKIISTSYNIDSFINDKVFKAALDYVYDKGVLHFNSAGNFNQKDPPREAFRQLILVSSTNQNDIKSSFSNYGRGIQISAPGEEILSTTPNNQYEKMSGTSMATPNAAGSAALIWAAHPSWNRDQIAAQLIGTADNIDATNPNFKNMLGSGRVNNYRAMTEKLAPVKIKEIVVTSKESTTTKKAVTITVYFDKLLDPNVVNNGMHWEVKSLADSSVVTAMMKDRWFTGTMALELVIPELKPGEYQLTIKDSLKDPFGTPIDGKASGKAGGDYIYKFKV